MINHRMKGLESKRKGAAADDDSSKRRPGRPGIATRHPVAVVGHDARTGLFQTSAYIALQTPLSPKQVRTCVRCTYDNPLSPKLQLCKLCQGELGPVSIRKDNPPHDDDEMAAAPPREYAEATVTTPPLDDDEMATSAAAASASGALTHPLSQP